jgi:hypothetical protein
VLVRKSITNAAFRANLKGDFMSTPKLMMAAAAVFLTSAGAAHALTTIPLDGYYTVLYTPTHGNSPSFSKPSGSLGTFTGTYSSSTTTPLTDWTFDQNVPLNGALSEIKLLTANPAGSCGTGCVSSTASGTITVTFTFDAPGVTGSLTETGTYQADYNGKLSCTNSSGSQTDCIDWAGAGNTPTGSVLKTALLSDGNTVDITFYNAQDWSITPEVVLGVNDPPAPTPLPAALPLFAGGLGLIGLIARRRKRKPELSTTEPRIAS